MKIDKIDEAYGWGCIDAIAMANSMIAGMDEVRKIKAFLKSYQNILRDMHHQPDKSINLDMAAMAASIQKSWRET